MDEKCRVAHAKLISGMCPWCGRSVQNGEVIDLVKALKEFRRPTAGPSVRSVVLDRGPLEPAVAAQYAIVVASLLDTHFSAKPHNNVSPDNIFVTGSGTVILGPPFTLADDELSVTLDNQQNVMGGADYLAPELALNSHKADQRADIYSLGCCLFFMLTGRPPFEGGSISEILLKHQTEVPISLCSISSQVSETLANICQKMLAKKPMDRYQTMQELQTALAICLDE